MTRPTNHIEVTRREGIAFLRMEAFGDEAQALMRDYLGRTEAWVSTSELVFLRAATERAEIVMREPNDA